jgi:hypothetical protein
LAAGFASSGTGLKPDAEKNKAIIERADAGSVSMEVMKMEEGTEDAGSPSVLPIVQHGTTQYFADLRLRQFRNVKDPHEHLDFDSEQGRKMCEQTGIVVCRECQMVAVVSPAVDRRELRCMNCLALIVPRVRL